MKLAFCLFQYIKHSGLSRDFMHIASEALHRGHEVHVYTMRWEGKVPAGFHVHILPASGLSNHARCNAFSRKLTQELKQNHYELVIGFNRLPGLDVYFAADVCFVANARAKHGFIYRLFPRYKTYASLEQSVFSRDSSTKILALNPEQISVYKRHYQTDERRFFILPPGIAKARFELAPQDVVRAQVREQLRIADQNSLILLVGSGFKNKGLQRALLAVAALPEKTRNNVRFVVVGRDDPKPWMSMVKKLGLQSIVSFMGARDDVVSLMLAADLLLHPAITELAGMVLIEALIAGLPVLTTESCGYAFHVKSAEAGLVVPQPFQQQTLNQALYTMLTSEKQSIWRTNAKKYAEAVDLYSLPQQAVNLFENFQHEKQAINA